MISLVRSLDGLNKFKVTSIHCIEAVLVMISHNTAMWLLVNKIGNMDAVIPKDSQRDTLQRNKKQETKQSHGTKTFEKPLKRLLQYC